MVKVAGNLKEIITDGVAEHMTLFPSLYRSTVPGPQGQRGPKGEQGISVHHIKGTETTNLLGDFGVSGEIDTYTFYGDADETINLGRFSISNGVTGAYDFTQFYRDKVAKIGDVATVLTTDAQTLLDAINELDSDKLGAAGGIVSGDLEVQGNFTVSGTATTVNSETVTTADNKIVINNGEVGTGVTNGEAGIEIDRGLATNYQFVFDEADDSFKIGEIGELQKVATREDAPLDTGVAIWDGSTNKFATTLDLTVDSVTVSGLVDGRDVSVDGSKLDTIETNAKDDQIASEVPVTPAGNLASTDVQAALEEVQTELDSATVHTTSDGSDHTFIDQDVTTTATPRFNSVQLNGGTGTQGTMTWNVDEETLDVVMDGTVLQMGQGLVVNVKNNTASSIAKGTVVMFVGTLGNSGRLLVDKMNGSVQSNAMNLIGLATTDIPTGTDGKATMLGKIRDIDTTGATYGEAWADGDVLYVSPTTPGGLTKIEPTSGQLDMPVAVVVHAHTAGSLYVRAVPVDRNSISPAIQANYYDKTAVGNLLAAQDAANEISYSNATSGLTATNVQTAVDEVEGRLVTAESKLSGIESGATADQVASEVPVTPQGNLSSTTVQSALIELQSDVDSMLVDKEW